MKSSSVISIIAIILVLLVSTCLGTLLYTGVRIRPDRIEIPPAAASEILALIVGDPNVVGLQIVVADLEQNTRRIVYTKLFDPNLDTLYIKFVATHISVEVPVFTDSHINNVRMTDLINHEFVCSPYADTISAKYSPDSTKYISFVCALGIPPTYGDFVGIVGLMLKAPPDENNKARLLEVASTIANISYQYLR